MYKKSTKIILKNTYMILKHETIQQKCEKYDTNSKNIIKIYEICETHHPAICDFEK